MTIPHATVLQRSHDGITTVSDLAEFDKALDQKIAGDCRRSDGRVSDPSPRARVGATIYTLPFR